MPDASALPTMTVEEYFRFEERSPIKHEYVAGEVYAMSGATWRHNLIAGTIFGILLGAEGYPQCTSRRRQSTSESVAAARQGGARGRRAE
jgi:Uma2 family endonuclease